LSQYFVVREKEWSSMVHHLVDVPASKQRVFVITGIGGCGKTQMVSYFLQEKGPEYVQQSSRTTLSDQTRYTYSIFVDASSLFALKADLQAWAQSLGDGHDQDLWEDALRILASGFGGARWILVFDNADDPTLDLNPFLPKCYNGTVIITSRNRDMGNLSNTHHMELGEMEKDEALSTLLLAARRQGSLSPDEERDARQLVEKLGYLAVALVQAGTYCYQISTAVEGSEQPFAFAQYITLFSSQRAELMKKHASFSLDNYQLGAYTAFDISYKAIPQVAKDFLHFIASFHYSSIPLSMFSTAVQSRFNDPHPLVRRPQEHFDIELELRTLLCLEGKWNELRIHGIIRTLRSFSLVSASSASNIVFLHLHPLVHAWARDMMQSESRRHRIMAALVLNACSTERFFQLHQYLLPHFDDLLDNESTEETHVNDKFAAGVLLTKLGYYDKAERLLIRSLEVAEEIYGRGDSNCIRVAIMLAKTYHAHGKWKEAEALSLENLEHRIRLYGRSHPSTTNATNNLAVMYASQGRHKEAEVLYLEVLEHLRERLGKDDPDTIITANNLATVYVAMGRYDEAEALETEVLGQRRRLMGKDHPDTIKAVSNLATIYSSLGRYKEAELLELEALEQLRKALGKNHPDTITAANNLAETYSSLGRHKEAMAMGREVLEQREELLGQNHPDTLVAANNLVTTYLFLGRRREAELMALQTLEQLRMVLGKDHPETLNTMSNLATTHNAQGRHKEAERLLSEVLEKRAHALGKEHPKTLLAAGSLASTYSSLGRYKEAEVLELEVLEKRRKVMGNNHPDTLNAASNLAVTYGFLGRYKEASALGAEVLELRRKVLGNDHPGTLFAANNLVDLYNMQGYHKKAEDLVTQVMEQSARVLGKEHPDTLRAASGLGVTWDSQDRHKEAEELLIEVLEQRRKVLGNRHPDTIQTMYQLAISCANQDKGKIAESLLVEAVTYSTEVLGKEHPHTQFYVATLADVQRPSWRSRYSFLLLISSLAIIVSVLVSSRFKRPV
jgi:tetratricopeptide (TPR) repeat protein